MKTVGIKCPFCGGAVEFGEGEKTATEQKKKRGRQTEKECLPRYFFRTVSFLRACPVTDAPV